MYFSSFEPDTSMEFPQKSESVILLIEYTSNVFIGSTLNKLLLISARPIFILKFAFLFSKYALILSSSVIFLTLGA